MYRIPSRASIGITGAAIVLTLALVPIDGPARAAGESAALKLLERPVKSDRLLKSLIGRWKGTGIVKQGSDLKKETLNCRTTNVWTAQRKLMKMTLLCIGVDFRFRAVGFIGRTGREYRGDWNTFLSQSATLKGRRGGNGLVLTLASNSGKSSPSTLRINLSGRRLTNTLTRRDRDTGKTYTAFTASLQK